MPFLPFNEDLNRLTLRVKHLDTPRARIVWGGETNEFQRTDLEAGINLAAVFRTTPFDVEFQRFLFAVNHKQSAEEWSIMKYIANYLMDPADFEKDAGMRKSLAQLKVSFAKYRDRSERETYLALPVIHHVIEVQPIR